MPTRRAVVCSHGHCFDGLASAAVFRELLRALRGGDELAFEHRSCGYGPRMRAVPERWLVGDVNAILDFRYTESDALDFYFDHHVTGLGSEAERVTAEERVASSKGRRHFFWAPTYGSATQLVADVAKERFGVDLGHLGELVRWADRIDTARFASADDAFFSRTSALELADVIERHGDGPFYQAWAGPLAERPLDEVARAPEIAERFAVIRADKDAHLASVRAAGVRKGRVAFVDLGHELHQAAGKFASYVAFPDAVYTVTLLRTAQQLKIGVGYNPWCGTARDVDIAPLCAAEGGGGHPVVGGVALPEGELERARAICARLVEALL